MFHVFSLFSSLLQHYKMYEFMFCHTQAEEIIGTDVSETNTVDLVMFARF